MRNRAPQFLRSVPVQDPPDPDDGAPLSVEPDEGPIPAMIPDDPEYARVVEPMDWHARRIGAQTHSRSV